MQQYHDTLQLVLDRGFQTTDRTQTGTRSYPGTTMRFDLSEGFPLVASKKLHLRAIFHELIWFLSGDTNIKYLKDNNVRIWDEWADEKGDLGPVYGQQWRCWEGHDGETFDQIKGLQDDIKQSPDSRRLIVSAWNVGVVKKMALPPCHTFFQVKIYGDKLNLIMYQRSGDLFLGVPFNIACYAAIQLMLCKVTGYQPGEFIHMIGDAHIYNNHRDQVDLQLSRPVGNLSRLVLKDRNQKCLTDFVYDDFVVEDYEPLGTIKAPVAV
jgi:thymidylate synthase